MQSNTISIENMLVTIMVFKPKKTFEQICLKKKILFLLIVELAKQIFNLKWSKE
jgi:hypothetical protein